MILLILVWIFAVLMGVSSFIELVTWKSKGIDLAPFHVQIVKLVYADNYERARMLCNAVTGNLTNGYHSMIKTAEKNIEGLELAFEEALVAMDCEKDMYWKFNWKREIVSFLLLAGILVFVMLYGLSVGHEFQWPVWIIFASFIMNLTYQSLNRGWFKNQRHYLYKLRKVLYEKHNFLPPELVARLRDMEDTEKE
jgi:hypothetical protein